MEWRITKWKKRERKQRRRKRMKRIVANIDHLAAWYSLLFKIYCLHPTIIFLFACKLRKTKRERKEIKNLNDEIRCHPILFAVLCAADSATSRFHCSKRFEENCVQYEIKDQVTEPFRMSKKKMMKRVFHSLVVYAKFSHTVWTCSLHSELKYYKSSKELVQNAILPYIVCKPYQIFALILTGLLWKIHFQKRDTI